MHCRKPRLLHSSKDSSIRVQITTTKKTHMMEYYKQSACKMCYTNTKDTVNHLFHKWQQKGKVQLNKYNTANLLKLQPA